MAERLVPASLSHVVTVQAGVVSCRYFTNGCYTLAPWLTYTTAGQVSVVLNSRKRWQPDKPGELGERQHVFCSRLDFCFESLHQNWLQIYTDIIISIYKAISLHSGLISLHSGLISFDFDLQYKYKVWKHGPLSSLVGGRVPRAFACFCIFCHTSELSSFVWNLQILMSGGMEGLLLFHWETDLKT